MIAVDWILRAAPLPPRALFAEGACADALVHRLLRASLAGLRGVATEDAVVILGDFVALPWVDGVRYLGQDADAPALLMPTTHRPNVPVDLLERALLARAAPGDAPLAVVASRILPTGGALPLNATRLQRWRSARAATNLPPKR